MVFTIIQVTYTEWLWTDVLTSSTYWSPKRPNNHQTKELYQVAKLRYHPSYQLVVPPLDTTGENHKLKRKALYIGEADVGL